MPTKTKSIKTGNTKRGRKKPISGSPITIGGGAGIDTERFIKFDPNFWHCDCDDGRLTLKTGKGVITSIEVVRHGTSGPISAAGVTDIKIDFD